MLTTLFLASAITLAMGADDACSSSGTRPDLHISVKTFGAMGPLRTAAILEEADRVWATHGVRFAWHVAAPGPSASPARNPEADSTPIDIWVQLIEGAPDRRKSRGAPRVLGSVTFENDQPLNLVRIPIGAMTNAIRDVYRSQGQTFHALFNAHARILERALGRALAHELGHILLRSSGHTRSGLMRANVSGVLFISPDPVDLGLDRTQIAQLRPCDDTVARGIH